MINELKYTGEKNKALLQERLSYSLYAQDGLKLRCYGDSIILPYKSSNNWGGVFSSKRLIQNSLLHEDLSQGNHDVDCQEAVYKDKDAIFLGSWIDIYGHSISDNIKKLWYLFSDDYKQRDMSQCDLVFIYCSQKQDVAKHIKAILLALGIEIERLVRIQQVTQYRRVYIPDNSIIVRKGYGRFYTDEYAQLVDTIITNIRKADAGTYNKKIYLTRSGINDKKDFNEVMIENLFKQKGYQIVSPERHTFAEQVQMMYCCDSLVATEGSVSHNALFLKRRSELVILKKASYINSYQLLINELRDLHVIWINVNKSLTLKTPWGGPYFLWKTKELCEFLGIRRGFPPFVYAVWYRYLWEYFKREIIVCNLKRLVKGVVICMQKVIRYCGRFIKKQNSKRGYLEQRGTVLRTRSTVPRDAGDSQDT